MTFTSSTVNHFVSMVANDHMVAVFNKNTGTVQVFDETTFAQAPSEVTRGWRRVRVTKANDARVMFN